MPPLTETHVWHKGRKDAEGRLVKKIISGVAPPTPVTQNKKDRMSTKSQREAQTNIETHSPKTENE